MLMAPWLSMITMPPFPTPPACAVTMVPVPPPVTRPPPPPMLCAKMPTEPSPERLITAAVELITVTSPPWPVLPLLPPTNTGMPIGIASAEPPLPPPPPTLCAKMPTELEPAIFIRPLLVTLTTPPLPPPAPLPPTAIVMAGSAPAANA